MRALFKRRQKDIRLFRRLSKREKLAVIVVSIIFVVIIKAIYYWLFSP